MSSITSGGTPRSGQDLAGSQGAGRRPQVPGRDDRAAARLTSLALLGQENQARSFARLAAWNKRQVQRLERKAKGAITPSGS